MPGVAEVLPQIGLPLALWANTRVAAEAGVRAWLDWLCGPEYRSQDDAACHASPA